ncbi:uncharacterized protein LOC127807435 [Diospyros lotus]|uniref:uncharacterized protein LOC127807435 n=1 Tax=Diospyros lotus TaxID=55363 RepID=UPI0022542F36|nr:uncharacterized protein LOC127807435 [Diospyros lotus]
MKGIGGPLLCIGDLLSDVGEGNDAGDVLKPSPPAPSSSNSDLYLQPSDLIKHFLESYDQLNEALAGTDHSWTAFTLELCTALETANKLIQATSSHVGLLSEKVGELERVIRRGDSAIAAAKAVHNSLSQKEGLVSSRVEKQGL